VHDLKVAAPDRLERVVVAGELQGEDRQALPQVADDRRESMALVGNPAGEQARGQPALDGGVVRREGRGAWRGPLERVVNDTAQRLARRPPRDARGDIFERRE